MHMSYSKASSGRLEGTRDPGPDAQAWDPGPRRSLQATPPLASPWHPDPEAGAVMGLRDGTKSNGRQAQAGAFQLARRKALEGSAFVQQLLMASKALEPRRGSPLCLPSDVF